MKQLFWFKKKKISIVAHTPNPGSWETKPYISEFETSQVVRPYFKDI